MPFYWEKLISKRNITTEELKLQQMIKFYSLPLNTLIGKQIQSIITKDLLSTLSLKGILRIHVVHLPYSGQKLLQIVLMEFQKQNEGFINRNIFQHHHQEILHYISIVHTWEKMFILCFLWTILYRLLINGLRTDFM